MSTSQLLPLDLLPILKKRKFRTTKIARGEGEGTHPTKQRGFGIEFSEYRAYEPGDNPKHIDWNHFAKSDKLYIKLFHEEKALSILILVDSSSSMFTEEHKWNYVKRLTLALGAIGITSGERVSVSILQGKPLVNLSKLGQLVQIADLFTFSKSVSNHDFLEALITAQNKTKTPSQAIFLSDFLQTPETFSPILDALTQKNLALTGIQVLGLNDLDPLAGSKTSCEVVDSETGQKLVISLGSEQKKQYETLLEEHTSKIKDLFYKRNAKFFSVKASQEIEDLINNDFRFGGLLA